MAVEVGVACPEIPDAGQVSRLVGSLMSAVLRRPLIRALVSDEDGSWTISWGTTSTGGDMIPPGSHEFADCWFLNVAVNERGIDLSRLLTLVTGASISIITGGQIVD